MQCLGPVNTLTAEVCFEARRPIRSSIHVFIVNNFGKINTLEMVAVNSRIMGRIPSIERQW